MSELLAKFWYLWLLLALAGLYRLFKPVVKGWFGEKKIALYLSMLPKDEYTVLNDVILSTENGTTQIDHIVVSPYGVFVIETKNYTGWIFGGEKSAQWTQNIYGKKNRFMNPIRQNYAHVKAVEARLTGYPELPIIPIVAFSSGCDLKVKTESHVVYFNGVCKVIRRYQEKVLDAGAAAAVAARLSGENIKSSAVKREHVAAAANKKAGFENAAAGGQCPKCGGTLIERRGKFGTFLGCTNYPQCRFTKQM